MRLGIAIGLVLANTIPALAQPAPSAKKEAGEHFKKAQAADAAARWQEAIDEYTKAYDLVPHVDTLFNIAFDYEHLEDWGTAADLYQRYLDERDADSPAKDAAAVAAKIRELRRKVKQMTPPPPPPPDPVDHPVGWGTVDAPPSSNVPPPTGVDFTATPPYVPSRFHAGASYGIAVGNTESERYLAHGGISFASHRLELDGVLGAFGVNDYAIGAVSRFVFAPSALWSPFIRAGVTVGIAKSDASSRAGTRFPVGFEAGGGLQFGKRGHIEVQAVIRTLTNGWDASSTFANSYVNDSVAFAIDLGLSADIPVMAGAR